MNINPLAVPTLLVGVALFSMTLRWFAWPVALWKRMLIAVGVVAAAVPGALFDFYYAHWFDRAGWFYQYRSLLGTELTAAGLGLTLGIVAKTATVAATHAIRWTTLLASGVLLVVCLAAPYIKPVISPLDLASLRDRRKGPVCLQTSQSTCGPASAVTLLRRFGVAATEAEIARECYSSGSGTENWYLARAIRRRGLVARYVIQAPNVSQLPNPSIAGLGYGHFVTVLGKSPNGYAIGDPVSGLHTIAGTAVPGYGFSGFFLVVRPSR